METSITVTRVGNKTQNVSGILSISDGNETCDVCYDVVRKGEYYVIIEPCGVFCTGCVDWDE